MPIFMQYDGIKGQVAAPASRGGDEQIEVTSFTWGVSSQAAGTDLPDLFVSSYQLSGHADGQTTLDDFVVVKQLDQPAAGIDTITDFHFGGSDIGQAGSSHPGGANFCLGDGSVRFAESGGDLVW